MTLKQKADKYEEVKAEADYWKKLCEAYDILIQGFAGSPGLITAGYQQIDKMRDKGLEAFVKERERIKKDSVQNIQEYLDKIKEICLNIS